MTAAPIWKTVPQKFSSTRATTPPTAGTKLYAWINDDSAHKVSYTIYITGLSGLPQTGQDFTLVYVFGGLCAALLVAAGVWYGIRKKRVTNA